MDMAALTGVDAVVARARDALERGEGKVLAKQLDPFGLEAQEAVRREANPARPHGRDCAEQLRAPYSEMLAHSLSAAFAALSDQPAAAFTATSSAVASLFKEFQDGSDDASHCALAAVRALLPALRYAALIADGPNGTSHQSSATKEIQKFFSICLSNKSRRPAALRIASTQLKLYFKLNSLALCTQYCDNIDRVYGQSPYGSRASSFPTADQVSYAYYRGRLSVLSDDYSRANTELEFAFLHCHPQHQRNKQRVLRYLVPVKLLRGKIPSVQLLYKYNLAHYEPVVEAVKLGDINRLSDVLVNHQERFVSDGVYLSLERVRDTVYRTLLKRIFNISATKATGESEKFRIALWRIRVALAWLSEPKDDEEIECITASLISRRLIKGMINDRHKMLVLSKQKPFPSLTLE